MGERVNGIHEVRGSIPLASMREAWRGKREAGPALDTPEKQLRFPSPSPFALTTSRVGRLAQFG